MLFQVDKNIQNRRQSEIHEMMDTVDNPAIYRFKYLRPDGLKYLKR